jgi:hypothetical protein
LVKAKGVKVIVGCDQNGAFASCLAPLNGDGFKQLRAQSKFGFKRIQGNEFNRSLIDLKSSQAAPAIIDPTDQGRQARSVDALAP